MRKINLPKAHHKGLIRSAGLDAIGPKALEGSSIEKEVLDNCVKKLTQEVTNYNTQIGMLEELRLGIVKTTKEMSDLNSRTLTAVKLHFGDNHIAVTQVGGVRLDDRKNGKKSKTTNAVKAV